MEKLKRYLLPSALILVGLLAMANAQSITKALQLSQDATGAFGIDTNNNVYFPAHILSTGPVPVAANAGTGTAASLNSGATDFAGTLTGGAATNTTATITFGKAYAAAPSCVVVSQNSSVSPVAYNVVPTGINITSAIGASIINYVCSGAK